jgi:excisionase family DNA binding protein
MPDMAPEVMTLEEAAEYLRVHPCTIYRLVKKQKLPAFQSGKRLAVCGESA